MSDTTNPSSPVDNGGLPTPTNPTPAKASFFARCRKAFNAGFGGAVAGVGTACTALAATGQFKPEDLGNDCWIIAIGAVGGFGLAFGPAWASTNAPS